MSKPIFQQIQEKYNLTSKYLKMTKEQEQLLIKKYQNKKTTPQEKQAIIEQFWEAHKNAIVKTAFNLYGFLYKSFQGDMNLDLDDLINKGAQAITHCLNICYKIKQKPNESEASFKERQSRAKNIRFSTLLNWWIRPFIMDHINKQNFMIYVPHSKDTKKKSVQVASMDVERFDNSPKQEAEFIADDAPTPQEIVEKEMFWNLIKENLSPEDYLFLKDWLFLEDIFENKKEFYEKYNTNASKAQNRINSIKSTLKVVLDDYKNLF